MPFAGTSERVVAGMHASAWKMVSVGSGVLAAVGARKLIAAIWPGSHHPPLNPADRRISWREALAWGVASGIGAGVSRVLSARVAAAGWQRATGTTPPGLASA